MAVPAAVAANANVAALTRKFLTPRFPHPTAIPVIAGRIRGYDVAWSPHFSFNGSLPATIASSPGTTARVWVNWLNADQLQRMNATESIGQMYALGRLRAAPQKAYKRMEVSAWLSKPESVDEAPMTS